MPDRRTLVGRVFTVRGLRISADAGYAYADAIGDDPVSHEEHGTTSPFFAAALVAPLWRAVYQAPELETDGQRILHAEQRMLLHTPLRVGTTLTATAKVLDVVGFGFNDAVEIRCHLLDENDDNQPVVSMHSTLAVQGSSGYPQGARPGAGLAKGPLAVRVNCFFDEDVPTRYADAADDHNPLHLDDQAAREAGHPGRIVHGMCTLATGISALVNKLRDRPDVRLGYLRARFNRPVRPGDTVEFAAHTTGAHNTYAVGTNLGGRPVLKSCLLRLTEGACSR
jgi:acyl dehydratase